MSTVDLNESFFRSGSLEECDLTFKCPISRCIGLGEFGMRIVGSGRFFNLVISSSTFMLLLMEQG